MRRIREGKGLSIRDVVGNTPLSPGELSMIERGHALPRDDQLRWLTPVYGPPTQWWPSTVLRALLPDLADCLGCGDELDPDASGSRRYHGEICRNDARRHGPAETRTTPPERTDNA